MVIGQKLVWNLFHVFTIFIGFVCFNIIIIPIYFGELRNWGYLSLPRFSSMTDKTTNLQQRKEIDFQGALIQIFSVLLYLGLECY